MATIKNIIQTVFTSQGAGNTVKDVEQLGRAQTRLGQASSSAGRSFAAQSQGLGGLVAAYAGAAATTFALQQAYDKLSKAAQVTQTLEGLKSLAAASGESSTKILKSIQEITKGQLTLAESAQQANLALSAGFSGKQIERLSGVATKASRALGRDLGDAYTRVIRGSAKMETELLDELGIYTKIEPATRAYAAAMGKTVGQLTEFERRQAFANAVILEGERKFKSISTVIPTSAEKLSAFGTKIVDIVTQLGMVIADVVAPLAEFLTNNLAGAFGAVGIAAGLVASKGIVVLKDAIGSFADSWEQKGDMVRQKIIDLSPAAKKAQKDISNLVSSIDTAGNVKFLKQSDQDIKKFQDIVSERNLSSKETQALKSVLKERQQLLVEEGNRLLENKNKQEQLVTTLKKSTKEYVKINAELTKTNSLININNDRLAYTDGAYERLGEQAALTATKTGTALGGLFSAPVKAGASVLKLGASLVSLGANALSVVSVISILGSTIAGLVGKQDAYNALVSKTVSILKGFFTSIDSSQAKKALTSLGASAFDSIEKTNSALREVDTFTFETKELGISFNVEKTKENLVGEVTDALASAVKDGDKTWGESIVSPSTGIGIAAGAGIGAGIGAGVVGALGALAGPAGIGIGIAAGAKLGAAVGAALGGAIGTAYEKNFNELPKLADNVANDLKAKFGQNIFSGVEGEQLSKALQILEDQVGVAKDLSFQGRLYYETQQELAISLRRNLNNFREIQQVAEQLGVDASIVNDKFDVVKKGIEGIVLRPKLDIKDQDITITIVNQEEVLKNIDDLKKRLQDLAKPPQVFIPPVQVDSSSVTEIMSGIGVEYVDQVNVTVDTVLSNLSKNVDQKLSELNQARATLQKAQADITALRAKGPEGRTDAETKQLTQLQILIPALSANLNILQAGFDAAQSSFQQFKDTYGPGIALDPQSVNTFVEALKNVNVFSNQAATGGAKLENLLADLSSEAKAGALDLETFAQKKTAIQSLYSSLITDSEKAANSLQTLKEVRQSLETRFGADGTISQREQQSLNLLDQQIAASEILVDTTNALVDAESARVRALYAQLSPIEEQLRVAKQLKDTFGDLAKPVSTIGFFDKNGAIIVDDLQKQIAQQEYLNTILKDGADVYAQRQAQQAVLNNLTETGVNGLRLTKDQQLAILSANKDTIDTTLKQLGINGDMAAIIKSITTLSQEQVEQAKNVETSLAIQVNLAAQILEKVNSITKGFKEQLKAVEQDLNKFLQEDKIKKITLQAELDQISSDIAVQAIQAEIKKFQDEIALVQAKVENKKISPVSGAEQENALQQRILDAQRALLDEQFRSTTAQIQAEKETLAERLKSDLAVIDNQLKLNKAKIESDVAFLEGYAKAQAAGLVGQAAVLSDFNVKFTQALNSFGKSLNGLLSGIPLLGDMLTSSFESIKVPEAIDGAKVGEQLTTAVSTAESVGESLITGYETYANQQTTALLENSNLEMQLLDKRQQKEAQAYNQSVAALGRQGVLEGELAEKRVADAKKAGAEDAKKREEQLKKLREDYSKAVEDVTSKLLDLLTNVVKEVGDVITKSMQAKIEAARANEEVATYNLTATTEALSEAKSKEQELLQNELSLRQELEDSYKSLAEVQKTYVESLTGDDRSIKQSSRTLIDNILDQKRKQLDLSKTISARLRQDNFVQSLEERKLTQEQRLEAATKLRVAAEERLEEVQGVISTLTDLLSGQMFTLSASMQALSKSVAEVQGVVGEGMKLGFSQADISNTVTGFGNTLVNNLLFGKSSGGILNNAVTGLIDAGKKLFNAGSTLSDAAAATGSVKSLAPLTSQRPMPNPMRATAGAGFWGTAGAALGGAMTGFGIGNIVGALTKDPGMGSSIGGAIGGAIAAAFPAIISSVPVLSSIAGGIGSALGIGLGLAIPVLGAIAGAAIGRLFSKNPKAGAVGTISGSGEKTIDSSYARKVPGGTVENLSDLTSGISSLIGSLETAGIAFKDTLTYSVSFYKDRLDATLISSSGTKSEAPSAKSNAEGSKQIAEFFLDSFVKSLKTGSLVVDKTIQGAANLQAAIDKFVTEDDSTKTVERLKAVLDYAASFSATLEKLGEAVPVTMNDALNKIIDGSKAAASAAVAQYQDLKQQAADVFGISSAPYQELNKKIKENALAQLGLAEGSDGVVRSVSKANEELNAGTLAIANIVEGITNFNVALVEAGFAASDAASIIDIALNTQLTDFIGAIGEDLKNSIDILKNPAIQSAIELQAIIENAQERNKQTEGVLAGLKRSEDRISQSNIEKAIDNVSKSVELGALEVERYLESLNIEQLKAVVADEDRIDAATRLAASSRLVALEDQNRSQAAKQFVKVSREFNKGLAEITKSSAVPQFVKQATSVIEVAELLGRNSIDQFSIDFSNLVNSIARGENISSNFETAIAGLNAQLAAGSVTYTQLVEALDLLQSTALDSIQVLSDLVSSVEETTSQIYDLYSSSLDNLLTATDEIGSNFSDLLDGFKDKTQSVLGLFDDTLKSVAESGNKLYELKDKSKDAFDAAVKAVSEFEKTNKLTGRTVTQVTSELTSVSAQIAALSSKPFDLSSFLSLGTLSSKQRALQTELSKLTTVQEEYGKLIAARTTAEQDYLFANKTVSDLEASTTSKLLDTRIKESETVQEVKNAALEFVSSQKDLQDITQLLTAANFNLNQARFQERDRVVQVSEALRDLTTIAGNLIAEVQGINTTDVNAVKAQAKLAAEVQYGTAATAQITAAVNQATAEFNSLKAVATSVASVVNSTVGVGATFTNAVTTASNTLKVYDSLLTDSFEGYTTTISGYVTNIGNILKTSFDTTDITNFNGFITNLNKTQDALQLLSPTLNQLLADSKLGVIAGITQSIGESVSSFQSNIISAVSGLLDAFSPERKSKVDAFREALAQFDKIGVTINATGGLTDALTRANSQTTDLASKLSPLVANFASLNAEVTKLNDVTNATTKVVTPGQLSQARAKITEIATALQNAWNSVQFQVNTNLGTGITVRASVDAGSALTANDRGNLKSIASNSRLFPAIGALGTAGYTAGVIPGSAAAFAEGGYVQGPGSATSDSIPAKLSNGEYVMKASTVRRVGKNLLDEINTTGNLGYALSKQGRNGDSLVAHVNSDEVRMLLQSGGSGTFNPKTGLMEFFNKDGGAFGGAFEAQEIDKLMSSFSSSFTSPAPSSIVAPGGFIRMDNSAGSPQVYPYNSGEATRLMGFSESATAMKLAANAMLLGSRPLEARNLGSLLRISYGVGSLAASAANRPFNNVVAQANNGELISVDSNSVGIGPDAGRSEVERGGISARQNQLLNSLALRYGTSGVTSGVNSPGLQRAAVSEYVKSLNAKDKGLFFDFYMLGNQTAKTKGVRAGVFGYAAPGSDSFSYSSSKTFSPSLYTESAQMAVAGPAGLGAFAGSYNENLAPTGYNVPNPFGFGGKYAGTITGTGTGVLNPAYAFASGGLVKSQRDSVSAMLEPGEFVLRKQAVDRMGIDSAIRLNSTGNVGGDIDVEVNINNNGTNQTTVGTPEVRRENGKIVVDIILEDLRTNGPINRQIRSIR